MRLHLGGFAAVVLTVAVIGCAMPETGEQEQSESEIKTVRLHFSGFTKSKSGAT